MADIAVQASFNSGEWAPALFARVDIQKYRSGAALLENFFVDYRGGASTRAGTRFIYPAPDGQIRLIPFQETSELGYILVFTHLQIQFVSRGAVITEAAFNITAATQANPAVITVIGNNFLVGDLIFISGIGGMTQLNNRFFLVAATGGGGTVTLDDFFGNPVDSTGYGAYVSGGTAARIYSLPSPYSGSQLKDIKYAQNVDQMVLCHPDQPPYVLEIITANNWTLTPIHFGSTAHAPGTLSLSSSLAVGTVNYAYEVTSVDAGGQESGPSPQGNYLLAADLRTVGGSIQISWSAVEGAVSYNVYKADVSYIGAIPPGSTFGFIGFTTGTTFIDSNIGPDFTVTPPVPQNPFSGAGLFQTSVPTPSTYTTVPTVTLTGGSPAIPGSLAAVLQAKSTATVAAGGNSYAVGDTVTFSHGVTLQVHGIGGGGAVTSWEPFVGGPSNPGAITSGATPTNPVSQISTSGAGNSVTANLTWGVGYLIILNPGTGYTSNPTAVFAPAGAVAIVTIAPAFAGNPTVPGFFQQRLVLAAQSIAPQTFYMSKPGQFFNFDVSFPSRPDDSITETLVAGVLNTIEALVSSTSGMLILTDHGSWIVNGGSSGSAVSPTAIVANAQSFNGIRTQPAPIVANYDVLYPQQKGSSVRDLSFNIYFNVFTGTDISIMPSHLFFGHQIIDWCWAEEPFKVVWAIREDGVMLSCTYMKEQEFVGWAHHVTNSSFVAVASVTEPDEETGDVFVDAVYLAVERNITPPSPPPPPPMAGGSFLFTQGFVANPFDHSSNFPGSGSYPAPTLFGSADWGFYIRNPGGSPSPVAGDRSDFLLSMHFVATAGNSSGLYLGQGTEWTANAFDGADYSGAVASPSSQSFAEFLWVGITTLPAGQMVGRLFEPVIGTPVQDSFGNVLIDPQDGNPFFPVATVTTDYYGYPMTGPETWKVQLSGYDSLYRFNAALAAGHNETDITTFGSLMTTEATTFGGSLTFQGNTYNPVGCKVRTSDGSYVVLFSGPLIALNGSATGTFSGVNTGTVTLTSYRPSPTVIIVAIHSEKTSPTATVATVSDTAGLVWTRRAQKQLANSPTGYDGDLEVWWAHSPGALTADVITVTLTSVIDDASIIAFALVGAATPASPWDVNGSLPASATGNTTPPHIAISTTATKTASFIIGATAEDVPTFGVGTGLYEVTTVNNNGGTNFSEQDVQYKPNPAPLVAASLALGGDWSTAPWIVIADAIVLA